jgi:hypothetical protein
MNPNSVLDPGSGALNPRSGMGKNSGSGSGIRNEQPGSHFLELRNHFFSVKILKFFDADPGWKKFGSVLNGKKSVSGSGIRKNIPDPQN